MLFTQSLTNQLFKVGLLVEAQTNKNQSSMSIESGLNKFADKMSASSTIVASSLVALQKQYRSVSLHLGASEVIMKHKSGSLKQGDLQDILHVEHSQYISVLI